MNAGKGFLSVILNVVKHAKLLTCGLLISVAGAIVSALCPPLVLERIVNHLADQILVPFSLVLLYFALLVLTGIFNAAQETFITVFGQKTTRRLRHEMCEKLLYLPASYFIQNDYGVTASRFVNDVDTVEALFASGIISMFIDVCKVISILVVICVKSKGLGILMFMITPVLFVITRWFQKQMLKAQLANRVAIGKVNNHVPETIRNIRMIHTFHKEQYMQKRYDTYIQESYQAVDKTNFYDSLYSPLIIIMRAVIIAAMMILSAMGGRFQALFGISVGTAVAIIAYVGKVFEPLESIGMEIQNIQSAVAGVYRIHEFLQIPNRPNTDDTITCDILKATSQAAIELDGVNFSYDGEKMVLKNQSFQIQTSENVTLTGRTGAGKSTIFKLVLGLYQPDEGTVKIYGVQADQIPDTEKRKLFGYVEQSFVLVSGSVKEQITLFDASISQAEVEKAAKMVGLHEVIIHLESGYDTYCTQSLFSQGQMQLLAIARAIAADPMILLLDEITANLDSDTEARVLEALKKASKNRTVLSISHRLYEQTGGRRIAI